MAVIVWAIVVAVLIGAIIAALAVTTVDIGTRHRASEAGHGGLPGCSRSLGGNGVDPVRAVRRALGAQQNQAGMESGSEDHNVLFAVRGRLVAGGGHVE